MNTIFKYMKIEELDKLSKVRNYLLRRITVNLKYEVIEQSTRLFIEGKMSKTDFTRDIKNLDSKAFTYKILPKYYFLRDDKQIDEFFNDNFKYTAFDDGDWWEGYELEYFRSLSVLLKLKDITKLILTNCNIEDYFFDMIFTSFKVITKIVLDKNPITNIGVIKILKKVESPYLEYFSIKETNIDEKIICDILSFPSTKSLKSIHFGNLLKKNAIKMSEINKLTNLIHLNMINCFVIEDEKKLNNLLLINIR